MSDDPNDRTNRMPMGRVVFDERGNAVWKAAVPVSTDETLNRILDVDALSILEGEMTRKMKTLKVEDGYDPYSSGVMSRDTSNSTRNLRALGDWVNDKKTDGKR
ncbi:MAG: hypothetical protein ACO3K0_06380 [Steroidobacteraceae bacterium]|jgi:hypothetical protein